MKYPPGVRTVPRPKMKNHRGRTWDQCDVILPDGQEIIGYLDTSWSEFFYFEVDGVWRKALIIAHDMGRGRANWFDLRGYFPENSSKWKEIACAL